MGGGRAGGREKVKPPTTHRAHRGPQFADSRGLCLHLPQQRRARLLAIRHRLLQVARGGGMGHCLRLKVAYRGVPLGVARLLLVVHGLLVHQLMLQPLARGGHLR